MRKSQLKVKWRREQFGGIKIAHLPFTRIYGFLYKGTIIARFWKSSGIWFLQDAHRVIKYKTLLELLLVVDGMFGEAL